MGNKTDSVLSLLNSSCLSWPEWIFNFSEGSFGLCWSSQGETEVRLSWAPWASAGPALSERPLSWPGSWEGRSPDLRSKRAPTQGVLCGPSLRSMGCGQGPGSFLSSRDGGGSAWPLVEVKVCTQPSPQSPDCALPWGAQDPWNLHPSLDPGLAVGPGSAGNVSPTPGLGTECACIDILTPLPCKLGLRPKAPGSAEAAKASRQTTRVEQENTDVQLQRLWTAPRALGLDSPWHTAGAQQAGVQAVRELLHSEASRGARVAARAG